MKLSGCGRRLATTSHRRTRPGWACRTRRGAAAYAGSSAASPHIHTDERADRSIPRRAPGESAVGTVAPTRLPPSSAGGALGTARHDRAPTDCARCDVRVDAQSRVPGNAQGLATAERNGYAGVRGGRPFRPRPQTGEYACLGLDNTGVSAVEDAGIGRGSVAGDSIPQPFSWRRMEAKRTPGHPALLARQCT